MFDPASTYHSVQFPSCRACAHYVEHVQSLGHNWQRCCTQCSWALRQEHCDDQSHLQMDSAGATVCEMGVDVSVGHMHMVHVANVEKAKTILSVIV